MRMNIFRGCALLSLLLASGCGSEKPVAKKAKEPEKKVAAAKESQAETPAPAATKVEAEAKAAPPATDNAEAKKKRPFGLSSLFKAPEIPQELLAPAKTEVATDNKPKIAQPRVRLLGFAKIDGEKKALLEVGNDVVTATAGDVVDGVEVIDIVNDEVTFQFAKARWTTQLFQQNWFNEQSGNSSSARIGATGPSTRGSMSSTTRTVSSSSHARTAKPIFQNTKTNNNANAAGTSPLATGGNIPGIPGVSGGGGSSIPGMPAASSSGAPGAGGGLPSGPAMPGAMPGGGGMPAMPGMSSLPGSGAPSAPGGSAPTLPGGGAPSLPGGGAPGLPGGGGLPAGS